MKISMGDIYLYEINISNFLWSTQQLKTHVRNAGSVVRFEDISGTKKKYKSMMFLHYLNVVMYGLLT